MTCLVPNQATKIVNFIIRKRYWDEINHFLNNLKTILLTPFLDYLI